MMGYGSKMAVFLKRSKIKTMGSPLELLQKIRGSRPIKSEVLLKIRQPYVVIIPPKRGEITLGGWGWSTQSMVC